MLGTAMLTLAAGVGALAGAESGIATQEKSLTAAKGTAPASMKVSFVAGLTRHEAAAGRALREVSDPLSGSYRRFPDRDRIAKEYGAVPEALQALRDHAGRAGLDVDLDRTGVFATVSGPTSKMSDWLGRPVRLLRGSWRGREVHLLTSRGPAPAAVRRHVPEFVGIDLRVTRRGATSSLSYSGRNPGRPRSCLPAVSPKVNEYTYSYNQLRTAYGIDALPAGAVVGRKTRVTILGQGEGFSHKLLFSSAMCFGLHEMDFERVSVPGLRAPLPVGDEGNLDVQVVQAVLPPRSRVTVVESVGFDEREFLVFATAYGRKQVPHVVTTSYGYCEPDAKKLSKGVLPLTESVLLRMSLAGTTVFAASGDRGTSDCIDNETGRGPKRTSVDYPASSPHVISVGGTRLTVDRANRRVDEVVWNARKLAPPVGPDPVAGGGGESMLFGRPWWQDAVNTSAKRAVPDLSAHSAGGPAWPLFYQPKRAAAVGGTSAAAPFVAATVGVLAAQQGRGFGLLQPTLYALPKSSFFDVVAGSNDLHNRGCCRAHVGYDRASGLGAPLFDVWMRDLPNPA